MEKELEFNLKIHHEQVMKDIHKISQLIKEKYVSKRKGTPDCFVPNSMILWKEIVRDMSIESPQEHEQEYKKYLLTRFLIYRSQILEESLYWGRG